MNIERVLIKSAVVVTLQVEGTHSWPDCPIEAVSFLRNPHRHLFHIKAVKEVSHDDRDVEIIMLKRAMKHYLKDSYDGDFCTMSCEMLAKDLILMFDLLNCEVLEDGENGAYLWKTKY